MLARAVLLSFCVVSFGATAQSPRKRSEVVVPVFSNPADSAALASADAELNKRWALLATFNAKNSDSVTLRRLGLRQEDLDSLLVIVRHFFAKADSYATLYFPRYVLWDTLSPAGRRSVKRVSFSGYKERRLPREILECDSLETIELVNSWVTVLPPLKKLKQLKRIEIRNARSRGKLRVRSNPGITEFLARRNTPGGLPRSYRKFPSLNQLDLDNSGTTAFPSIARNRKLTVLSLANNQLSSLDLPRKPNTTLEVLKLTANNLSRVPDRIGNFPSLLSLSCSNNKITEVADGIGKLKKLEYLILYGNELTAIPPVIFTLPSLVHLDLYYNRLQRVEDGAVAMQRLVELHLAHNEISHLPDSLGKLKNLKGLYVNNNHLSQLPGSIRMIRELKELRMGSNYFAEFPEALLELKNLSWLDVSRNELKHLPEEVFQRTNLSILSLYGNPWDTDMLARMPDWIAKLRAQKTSVLTSPPEREY